MPSVKQTRARIAFAFALTALYLLWNITGIGHTISRTGFTFDQSSLPTELPCRSLPGANETLVILRTGSTELEERLPVHLSTSFRCFPNHLIFSDLDEDYHGEHILDALADVSPDILEQSPDFELYRRLRKDGRAALDPSELAGSPDRFSIKTGKVENPGWKIDKWKFLPMVNRTLHERPGMKWYVFIEADSFILWSMLQSYLATLDSTQPIYAGKPTLISDDKFAHGGSGFVVSQPALRTVVDYYAAHKAEIEQFTDGHWAGDCVLGKTFTDSGVPLINAWPAIQGDYPGLVQYTRADARANDQKSRLWCGTPVSYHHMSPAMIEDLWNFEQDWIAQNNTVSIPASSVRKFHVQSTISQKTHILRHKDIFNTLVLPGMMSPRAEWDNLSDHEEGTLASAEECRARCITQADCRQYSFDRDRLCRTNVEPRLGRPAEGFTSGWVEERIQDFQQGMAPCGDQHWPF